MLNILWPLFLIVSFVYGIFNGRVEEINTAVFDGTKSAVELCISLLGTMCLWNGIMTIACETNIVKKLTKMLSPIMKKLFPDIKKENKVHEEISMAMFIVLNTASIQIIPTTVIAIRSSLKSGNATGMIVPVWIATICAAIAAIGSAKILMKKF